MIQLRLALPVFVTVGAAIGIGASYMTGNDNAMWANVSALCGWLIVTGDEIVKYLDKRN